MHKSRMDRAAVALALAWLVAASAEAAAEGACGSTGVAEVPESLAPLVALRQAKCGALRPYEQGFVEKQLLLVEKAERPPVGEWNLLGFYPRVQAIDHRSQLALGARFWQPNLRRSAFDLHGAYFYSKAGFHYGEGQAGVLPQRGDALPAFAFKGDDVFELVNVREDDNQGYALYGQWYYRWSPRYDFYGIGPDSSKEDRSDFRQKDKLLEGVAGLRLAGKLSLVARAGRWIVSTGEGEDDALPNVEEVFAPSEIPFFDERLEYNRWGGSLVFDGRDVRGNPHAGGVVAVQGLRFDRQSGEAPSFTRLSADARLYVPLGHRQRVLALRTYFTRDDADGRRPGALLRPAHPGQRQHPARLPVAAVPRGATVAAAGRVPDRARARPRDGALLRRGRGGRAGRGEGRELARERRLRLPLQDPRERARAGRLRLGAGGLPRPAPLRPELLRRTP